MTHQEIADIIYEAEQKFPVERWTINNIHVWPLIRIYLVFNLFTPPAAGTAPKADNTQPKQLNLLERIGRRLSYENEKLHNRRMLRRQYNVLDRDFEVLFLSYPMHRTALNGKMYNRLLDPIRDELEKQGTKTLLLELNEANVQHELPSHLEESTVSLDSILSDYRQRNFPFEKFNASSFLEGYDAMLEWVYAHKEVNTFRFDILKRANHTLSAKSFFKELLSRKKVKKVYSTCFYGYQHMGLYAAARELGIESIDVQHGMIGEFHPVYGRWSKMPEEGYELLPSTIYCWTEKDAAFYKHWSANAKGHHQIIVAGNPWLKMWEEKDKNDQQDPSMAPIIKIKSRHPDKKFVLYTTQPSDSFPGVIPPYMLETIRRSEDKYFWFIRLHPHQTEQAETLSNMLKGASISHYNVAESTHLPLPALLLHSDVHITMYSSVIDEAAYFGLPSVAAYAAAVQLFPREMAAGTVLCPGEQVDDILAAMAQQMTKKIA